MIGDADDWPGYQGLDPTAPAAERIITLTSLSDRAQVVRFANGDSAVIPQGIRDGRSESYNLTLRGGG
ncbi:MAG TPA: hypothetical protein VLL48_10515, partial [Longimicrobiales bacterium]|nr:hypothetical protein [Longimicrobiales bacterium]